MTEVCTIPVPELESREELPHVLNNVDEGEHDLGAFSAELLNEIQHFDKQKRLSGKFEFHIAVQHKAEEKDEEVSHTDYPQDDVNDDVSLRRVVTESLSFPHFSAELLEEIQHYNRDQQKIQSLPIVLKREEVLSSTGHPLASYNINVATTTNNIMTTNTHPMPSSTDWVCAICLDYLPEKNPNSISCLTCQFCVPCLFEYVKIQIEEKTPHMTAHWTIRCPCLMEGCELSTANVEQCINGEIDELKRGILLAKFHRFAQDLEVQHDSRKVFCPQRDCSAVVALPSKFNIFSFGRAKCQDCKHSFCSKCNNNHNRFLGCDSVSEYQFRMWRLSTRQGCKKCPGCKIYIEKNQGCSHMTCRACGTHFCWHCLRKNHGYSVYCKVLSALDSEEWGESTATRAVTKTLAVPGGLVVGGLAIGAVGVAAGLAVAGGAVALCASPAIFGYKYYRDRRSLALAATHLQHIRQEHILQHGIVFVLPSHMEYSYSWRVDKLLENMAGVSVPAPASNGNMPPPFRVAYTDYVLYFSPTPYAVPGFEEDDFPFTEGSNDTTNDTIFYINRYGERVDGVRPYLTPRRAYIQLSSDFVEGISAHGSESEARSGEQLSTALQDVFEQASRRTEDVVTI